MTGHKRPRAIDRLRYQRLAVEIAESHQRYIEEVTAALTARHYTLVFVTEPVYNVRTDHSSGDWLFRFRASSGSDDTIREANDLRTVEIYPVHEGGNPFMENAKITFAFIGSARRGFEQLGAFAAP